VQMKNYKEERTISDGSGGRGAKEWHLGPIGISSRIGHGEDARTSVPEESVMHWWTRGVVIISLKLEIFIFELGSID
jgi:hypothetical protein